MTRRKKNSQTPSPLLSTSPCAFAKLSSYFEAHFRSNQSRFSSVVITGMKRWREELKGQFNIQPVTLLRTAGEEKTQQEQELVWDLGSTHAEMKKDSSLTGLKHVFVTRFDLSLESGLV